jgi:hypothetical protein
MPRWIKTLLFFLLGLAGGLIYGWLVNPVEFVDTTPDFLRQDYRTDYVLMIAESFTASGATENAVHYLTLLSAQPPVFTVAEAIAYAETAEYAPEDLALMKSLLMVMQSFQSGGMP